MFNIFSSDHKNKAELDFWQAELELYIQWCDSKISLYKTRPPSTSQKIATTRDRAKNAAMTWNKIFQERKYLVDLDLKPNTFSGMRLCDIGAGPHPSSLCFNKAEIYGVDHLMREYSNLGYPMGEYDHRYHFIQSDAEKMPFPNNYFDAIISVNAIDHVDDLAKASQEIKRVSKKQVKFRMHVHYHAKTTTEPLELNDQVFKSMFSWVTKLHNINESKYKDIGRTQAAPGELYVVWTNF